MPDASRSEQGAGPLGRLIPARHVHPSPDQPRHRLGDLDPLVASIRDHGLLQPILVRKLGEKDYQIIAGERRFRAAVRAGLDVIPCIEREATSRERLELALVENLLREDLSPFEEAEACEGLVKDHGHTHASLARELGRSRVSVTESLTLLRIPARIRDLCQAGGIVSRRQLLKVARQADGAAMESAVNLMARGLSVTPKRSPTRKWRRKGPHEVTWTPKGGHVRLRMRFRRSDVGRTEVIATVRAFLKELEEAPEAEPIRPKADN